MSLIVTFVASVIYMVRKSNNIVLAILLLISTSGISVSRHYCGTVQRSVTFFATPKACCGGSCTKCHNVFKFTKVNDDFEAGASISAQSISEIISLHPVFFIDLFIFNDLSPLTVICYSRADFNHQAGCAPAFLSTFRC